MTPSMHLDQAVFSSWRGRATAEEEEEEVSDDVTRKRSVMMSLKVEPAGSSRSSLPAAGPVGSFPPSSCPEF